MIPDQSPPSLSPLPEDFPERILKVITNSNRVATSAIDVRDNAVHMALRAGVPIGRIAAELKMPEWSVQLLADRAERISLAPLSEVTE